MLPATYFSRRVNGTANGWLSLVITRRSQAKEISALRRGAYNQSPKPQLFPNYYRWPGT
jgi:hypothetical protein